MKKVLALTASILLSTANLYAADGDLIVDGDIRNVGHLAFTDPAGLPYQDNWIGMVDWVEGTKKWLHIGGITDTGGDNLRRIGLWGDKIYLYGNVGIGTMSPEAKLHVVGMTTSPVLIQGDNIGSWNNSSYATTNTTSNKSFVFGARGTGFSISSETPPNNAIRFWIDHDSGNVGIGTSAPDPGYKLTVVGSALASGGVWQNSDIRLKKNILPVEGALDKVLKLNGVSYEWKDGKDFEGETLEVLKTDEEGKIKDDKYRDLPEGRTLGVIAQELEKVLPEAVNTGKDGIKAVSYSTIIPVLIEAMKEQQKQITAQQKQIEQLNEKLAQPK